MKLKKYILIIMILHTDIKIGQLMELVKEKKILFGGNRKLKIFGTLKCGSGKRMKKINRVFFSSENEALDNGYRPCGNCMRKYTK